jgi:peptidyl-prolyl cis-trans isomerase D
MATSIGKLSKSFFVKLLVGIIVLPFVFWGMGDVFRGGNQNVIATIDSKKVSAQEFVNYLNRLNLNEEQIKNLTKTNLIEKILSEYIGKKVMSLEIEKSGITVNDNSLRNIIKNDQLFFKDNKFSRTEYEKFLLKSGITAPAFEKNIVEQESKRQFLSFLAGGITIPDMLVENAFKKENQTKTIKYIDLEKYHSSKKPSQTKIKELYNKNKDLFIKEFKSIQYAEITPQIISGNTEYDKAFFKQLDILENKILDGESFEESSKENNLKTITIKSIDESKKNKNDKTIKNLSDNLFKKIYAIKNEKSPEVLKVDNKYFLAEIKSIERNNRPIDDPDVLKMINAQLNFQNKIKNNTSIVKDMTMGGFDKVKMEKFASDNSLELKEYKISNLKQNEIFTEGIIKRIFLTKDGEVDLVTDSTLTKNFLILIVKTQYKKIEKNSNEFEQYEAKARLNLVNKIYRTFDENLNQKYKVELNRRTIDRVKNSF